MKAFTDWDVFFRELRELKIENDDSAKKDSIKTDERSSFLMTICQCENGAKLLFSPKTEEFTVQGTCNLQHICAQIKIDAQLAKGIAIEKNVKLMFEPSELSTLLFEQQH